MYTGYGIEYNGVGSWSFGNKFTANYLRYNWCYYNFWC